MRGAACLLVTLLAAAPAVAQASAVRVELRAPAPAVSLASALVEVAGRVRCEGSLSDLRLRVAGVLTPFDAAGASASSESVGAASASGRAGGSVVLTPRSTRAICR